jgi:NADPH:quinone reductase-like Zn-dependent oxidoreductase
LEVGGLVLGKRVLVTGATGGVGRMAVQLAHLAGAQVTALVRDLAASAGVLRRLGATVVTTELGGDFDVIVEGVGGATFGLAIEHLAPRGVLVNIATQMMSRLSPSGPKASTVLTGRGSTLSTSPVSSPRTPAGPAIWSACAPWPPAAASTPRSNWNAPGASPPRRSTPCWAAASAAKPCCTSTHSGPARVGG